MNGTKVSTTSNGKPIVLWCVPRSVSTAFERAFQQREDMVTMHEPYGDSFYFGPERLSDRYSAEYCEAHESNQVTFEKVSTEITSGIRGKRIFSKDMAYYIVRKDVAAHPENPTVVPLDVLRDMKHTFLIRSPKKSIPSYYRLCQGKEAEATGFKYFDPLEAGFKEIEILYNFVKHNIDPDTILIDADDLTEQPEKVIQAFCENVGIKFDKRMLQWEPSQVESFKKWQGFHNDCQQSTGFGQNVAKKKEIELPSIVEESIVENIPIYEALCQRKLKV